MLARFIAKRSHLRLLTLISSQSQISNYRHYYCPSSSLYHPVVPNPSHFNSLLPRHFSSNGGDNDNNDGNSKNQSDIWNLSSENDENMESVFGSDDSGGSLEGIGETSNVPEEKDWVIESEGKEGTGSRGILEGIGEGTSVSEDNDWVIESEGKDYDIFNEVEEVGKGGMGTIGGASVSEEKDWVIESEGKDYDIFKEVGKGGRGTIGGASVSEEKDWVIESEGKDDDIFKDVEEVGKEGTGTIGGAIDASENTWEGFEDWNSTPGNEDMVFDFEKEGGELLEMRGPGAGDEMVDRQKREEEERLEIQKKREEEERLETEAKELSAVLKGPDLAFGDLIAASGITDAMLDSLIALKDLEDIVGLPPLHEIEDIRYEKNTKKSSRFEIERQKQEEVTMARVRQVDSMGRAYGTGKRKCSIARVWIQPGEGKFVVNDKQFDVYFPMLDHRATLLRPFTETKTLGLMDVNCTVKGGGVSGQVGAIRLGISRALQNWAPEEHRPPLKAAGFLTRDSRIVERKKPGKAKARKSFQWVKR